MKNSYKEILSELKLNPNTKFIKDSKVYIMNELINEDDLKICEIYLSGLIIHDIYRGIYE